MSQLYYWNYLREQNLWKGLKVLFQRLELEPVIRLNPRVAIKTHFGERGNLTHIRPQLIRRLVDLVKEAGGKPFLVETTTLYPYKRFTAEEHLETAAINGFSQQTMGCPIVIADGDGFEEVDVPMPNRLGGRPFEQVPMAKGLLEADFLLAASHVKGHIHCGMGGAVKNLAMGCVGKTGKALQHRSTQPVLCEAECVGCGVCVQTCRCGGVELADGKPRFTDKCLSCADCLFHCPQQALRWPENYHDRFISHMTHAAYGIWNHFKGRTAYFNFLLDITAVCDCCPPAGSPLLEDIGVLSGLDPIALDQASNDFLDKGLVRANACMPEPPDRFGKLYDLNTNHQFVVGEKLKMGERDYRVEELSL